MATVHFTSHLQNFVDCESAEVRAETVGAALSQAFSGRAQLQSYVLDEHQRVRRHIMIFVDGKMIDDRVGLSDPLQADSEVFVMQALSGG